MKILSEQVILVTGATDGIGRLTAKDLAGRGARIIVHGRSVARAAAAAHEIRVATSNRYVNPVVGDLSSLADVRSIAEQVRAQYPQLDVLINNAGIGAGRHGEQRSLSADGIELRFAVNYLAPFLLTRLLLPVLKSSAPSRIVSVVSAGQSRIDFDDVMLERRYDQSHAYGQSKLALAMLTFDLAEELRQDHVTANCVHPGALLDTKMVREAFGRSRGSAQSGADNVEYLAISPKLDGVTGQYFDQRQRARAHPQAYDAKARQQLRQLSEELTGKTA